MGENLSVTSTGDTSQLSLGADQAHNNRTLFSDHYLEKLLQADPRWDPALPEAGSFLAWLQGLYLAERNQIAGYNESLGRYEEAFKAFVKALVRSMPKSMREGARTRTPVGRLGEPADIGNLVAFLASPRASFITGVAIPCDGGLSSAPVGGLD